MKKIILPIIFILLLVFSFAAGNHFGANNYLLANSANRALVLATELRMLRTDNTADLLYIKEVELSSEFRFHEQHINSNFKWLFPNVTKQAERSMKLAVKYRLEFPFTIPGIENTDVEFSGRVNQGLDDMNQSANRMVEKYK